MKTIQLKPVIAVQFQQVDENGAATDLPAFLIDIPSPLDGEWIGPKLRDVIDKIQGQLKPKSSGHWDKFKRFISGK